MSPVLDYQDLARLLRRSVGRTAQLVRAWRENDGFPDPLPGTKLWSTEQVCAWLGADPDKRKALPAMLAANDDSNPVVAGDQRALEERFLGGGRG